MSATRIKRGRRRVVRMPPELVEMLKEQDQRFREKFGREPGPDDPVFWDPDKEEPEPYTREKMEAMWDEMVQKAADIGIHPATVYAMKKTRMVMGETTPATSEQIEEWNAAIAEYYAREGRGTQ